MTIFTVKVNPPQELKTTFRTRNHSKTGKMVSNSHYPNLGIEMVKERLLCPPNLTLLEESFSAGHGPYSHMQTHLSLPEHPSTLITTISVQ